MPLEFLLGSQINLTDASGAECPPRLQLVPEPLHEDGEESAEAGVDVHRDAARGGDGGDRLDRVHRAVRIGRRGAQNLFSVQRRGRQVRLSPREFARIARIWSKIPKMLRTSYVHGP